MPRGASAVLVGRSRRNLGLLNVVQSFHSLYEWRRKDFPS